MVRYVESYGQDIDGNRGQAQVFFEIEQSDEDDIKAQVEEYLATLEEDEDPDTQLDIVLIDPVSEEDIYFTINIKDYR